MNKNVFKMAIVCCFSILISLTTSCSKDLVLKEPKTDFNEIKIIKALLRLRELYKMSLFFWYKVILVLPQSF